MANPKRKRRNPGGADKGPRSANKCNANYGSCYPACGQGCQCDCHLPPGSAHHDPIWVLNGRSVTKAEYDERSRIARGDSLIIDESTPLPGESCTHPGVPLGRLRKKRDDDEYEVSPMLDDDADNPHWNERLAPVLMTRPFMPAVEPPESDEEREARAERERKAKRAAEVNAGIEDYVRDCVIKRAKNLELD